MKRFLTLLFLFPLFAATAQNKKSNFYKPAPKTFKPVNDFASILSFDENNSLSAKLKKYRDSTGNVIVIITQNNLTEPVTGEVYSVEEVAMHYFNKWGIGDKIKNNGVLIFVAKENRKVRIATGKGVEEKLTDENCQYVIDNEIVPNFKQQQYFTGLNDAAETIFNMLSASANVNSGFQSGSYAEAVSANDAAQASVPNRDSDSPVLLIICAILVVIIIIALRKVRTNRHQYIGPDTNYSTAYNPGCGSFIPFMGYGVNRNYINNSNNNYYRDSTPHYYSNDNTSSYSSNDSSSSDSSYGGGSSDGGGASGSW